MSIARFLTKALARMLPSFKSIPVIAQTLLVTVASRYPGFSSITAQELTAH